MNVARALNRLTDPVFVAALSSCDCLSMLKLVYSGLLQRPGNEYELQQGREGVW